MLTSEPLALTLGRRQSASGDFPELNYSTPDQIADVDAAFPDRLPSTFTQQAVRLGNATYAAYPSDEPDVVPNVLPWQPSPGPLTQPNYGQSYDEGAQPATGGYASQSAASPTSNPLSLENVQGVNRAIDARRILGTSALQQAGVDLSGLPWAVRAGLEGATTPLSFLGGGEGGLEGLATAAGAGAGQFIASEGAQRALPEDTNPLLRGALELGAGLAGAAVGGGIGNKTFSWMEAADRALTESSGANTAAAIAQVPEAYQFGRGPSQDLINQYNSFQQFFPEAGGYTHAEDLMNARAVDDYLSQRGVDIQGMLEQDKRQLAGDLFQFERSGGGNPPITGTGGAEQAPEDFFAQMQAKKAVGEALTDDEQAQLLNMLGQQIGAIKPSEIPQAKADFYNATENLGGGQPITPEQQANIQRTVEMAQGSNTIRDALANAREGFPRPTGEATPSTATVDASVASVVRDPEAASFIDPQGRFITAKGSNVAEDHGPLAARLLGMDDTAINANTEAQAIEDVAKQGYIRVYVDGDEANIDIRGPLNPRQEAAIRRAARGRTLTYDVQGGGHSTDATVQQLLDDARSTYGEANAQPSALDKVISRNAEELPAPNRTVPQNLADLQARARLRAQQPPTAGGAAGETPDPFMLRPGDERVPNIEPRAEPFPDLTAEQEIAARARLGDNPFGFTPEEIASGHAAETIAGGPNKLPPPDSKTAAALQKTAEALNLWRTVKTAWDVSAPFRQGLMLAGGHPREFFGNMPQMIKSFASKETADAFDAALHADQNAGLWRESGLYVPHLNEASIGAREEAFMSRIARYFPGVQRSERAYVNYMNGLRTNVFDSMWEKLPAEAQTAENGQRIARWVNSTTGRGTIPEAMQDWAAVANGVLFSPRFMISRFESNGVGAKEIASLVKQGVTRQGLDPVSKQIANDYVKFLGTTAGAIALAKASGASVNVNPLSSEFGQVQVGNTRYDLTGGNATLIRYIAQGLTGKREAPDATNVTDYPRSKTATNFIRSKLSPAFGLIWDSTIGGGKTPGGNSLTPTTWAQARDTALDELAPMVVNDILEAARNNHFGPAGAALGLPSIGGVGVNTYDTSSTAPRAPRPPRPPRPVRPAR